MKVYIGIFVLFFCNCLLYSQDSSYTERIKKIISSEENIFSFQNLGKIRKKKVYGCGTWGDGYCGHYYYSKQRKLKVELRTDIKTKDSIVTVIVFRQNIEGIEFKYKINEYIDSNELRSYDNLSDIKYVEIENVKYYIKQTNKKKYRVYMIMWNKIN